MTRNLQNSNEHVVPVVDPDPEPHETQEDREFYQKTYPVIAHKGASSPLGDTERKGVFVASSKLFSIRASKRVKQAIDWSGPYEKLHYREDKALEKSRVNPAVEKVQAQAKTILQNIRAHGQSLYDLGREFNGIQGLASAPDQKIKSAYMEFRRTLDSWLNSNPEVKKVLEEQYGSNVLDWNFIKCSRRSVISKEEIKAIKESRVRSNFKSKICSRRKKFANVDSDVDVELGDMRSFFESDLAGDDRASDTDHEGDPNGEIIQGADPETVEPEHNNPTEDNREEILVEDEGTIRDPKKVKEASAMQALQSSLKAKKRASRLGEAKIALSARAAFIYANEVLGGARFPQGERAIKTSASLWNAYKKIVAAKEWQDNRELGTQGKYQIEGTRYEPKVGDDVDYYDKVGDKKSGTVTKLSPTHITIKDDETKKEVTQEIVRCGERPGITKFWDKKQPKSSSLRITAGSRVQHPQHPGRTFDVNWVKGRKAHISDTLGGHVVTASQCVLEGEKKADFSKSEMDYAQDILNSPSIDQLVSQSGGDDNRLRSTIMNHFKDMFVDTTVNKDQVVNHVMDALNGDDSLINEGEDVAAISKVSETTFHNLAQAKKEGYILATPGYDGSSWYVSKNDDAVEGDDFPDYDPNDWQSIDQAIDEEQELIEAGEDIGTARIIPID